MEWHSDIKSQTIQFKQLLCHDSSSNVENVTHVAVYISELNNAWIKFQKFVHFYSVV